MFPPSFVSLEIVDDDHYVEIPGFCEAIRRALQSRHRGGMKLIGAPVGAGKTTTVLKEVNRIASGSCCCRPTVIVLNELANYCFHDALKIPHNYGISAFVPKNTIIILHQVDHLVADVASMRNYIISIATDAYNSNKFCVLICLKSPEAFFQVATYNGGEKISILCYPSELRWSESQLQSLIDLWFPEWSIAGKMKLLELTRHTMSPGLIVQLREVTYFKEEHLFSPADKTTATLRRDARIRAAEWAKFEDGEKELEADLTFDDTFARQSALAVLLAKAAAWK
jgi:hypothetical protein